MVSKARTRENKFWLPIANIKFNTSDTSSAANVSTCNLRDTRHKSALGWIIDCMNSEELTAAFHSERARFRELFLREMKKRGEPLPRSLGLPSGVLSFAEEIMICPSEESASVRMQQGLI